MKIVKVAIKINLLEVEDSMVEVPFRRGEVLFREGEVGDFVCLVATGEVEVIKELGSQRIVLGTVRAGEYVGEMGVLEGQTRSATVRALTDGSVELIGRRDFLKRVAEDGETALNLLVRLSERLRSADRRYAAAAMSLGGQPSVPEEDPYITHQDDEDVTDLTMTVFADGPATEGYIPDDGLVMNEYPFVVGRRVKETVAHAPRIHLLLDDRRPFRLSRIHFAFERSGTGHLYVRDLGSTLGTQVNGEFLGADAPRDRIPLEPGETSVRAGGADSPFAFRVVVDRNT